MTARTAINWATALLIVAIYAAMQYLDGPSELEAMADQQADFHTAIKTEAAHARFTGAAGQICNGSRWQLVDARTVQCASQPSRRAARVAL